MKTLTRQMKQFGPNTAALLLLLMLWSISGHAQTGGVQGTVLDESNRPLAGASVLIKELNRQTSTNDEGLYSLANIPHGTYTISVSYIGYATASGTVTISGRQQVRAFTLQTDGERLDEMAVSV